jgi:hypothetical protein
MPLPAMGPEVPTKKSQGSFRTLNAEIITVFDGPEIHCSKHYPHTESLKY